jgi:hypothetical protein
LLNNRVREPWLCLGNDDEVLGNSSHCEWNLNRSTLCTKSAIKKFVAGLAELVELLVLLGPLETTGVGLEEHGGRFNSASAPDVSMSIRVAEAPSSVESCMTESQREFCEDETDVVEEEWARGL